MTKGNKQDEYLQPDRLKGLIDNGSPDLERWADGESYPVEWGRRSELASSLIPDNVSILEIGVGTGVFRGLVHKRCHYIGADLQPLDRQTFSLNLDTDPLPPRKFDYVVLLGVMEYLHSPEAVVRKICNAATSIVISYCFRDSSLSKEEVYEKRRGLGWVNDYDYQEFIDLFYLNKFTLARSELYKKSDSTEQRICVFHKLDR